MTDQIIEATDFQATVTIEERRGRGRPRIEDGRLFNDITRAEQIERWERVRHVLRNLSQHQIDKHFNMGVWLSKESCGTVGCAAGMCALDPWFNRRGYSVDWIEVTHTTIDPEYFFGRDGYLQVFVNHDAISYLRKSDGDNVDRKPRAQYRITLRNVNQYIKRLKAAR